MAYIDDHLLPNETVAHRARLHWIIFGWPIACGLAGAAVAAVLYHERPTERLWLAGIALMALALVLAVGPTLRYLSSDFAVTDKRVLAKFGLFHRRSLETLLSKIEAISVDQDLIGRLLGYGTVTIIGTGGTQEALPTIADPLEFRRRVQAQIVTFEDRGRVPPAPASTPAVARVERECPFCAEPILAKAKVCKHCGRDVA